MEAPLSSRIESVTVFARGARVRRIAELPGDVGGSGARVRLVRLPLTLDDRSVRAKVVGGTLVATDLRVLFEVAPDDANLAPPRDEDIEAETIELARLRAS